MRKILLADDLAMNRQMLCDILSDRYEIIEVSDGYEALQLLAEAYKEVSAILLDIVMPGCDGYEVLGKIHAEPSYSQIPVIVITGSAEKEAEIKALTLGATDFITKPFYPEIIRQRLSNSIRMRENASFVNALQNDELTGIYNRKTFFDKASEMIHSREAGYYVLACFDINKFKVINDQFGVEKGDEVLKFVADTIKEGMSEIEGICARFNDDDFALLYPQCYTDSPLIDGMHYSLMEYGKKITMVTISIGRYLVNDVTVSVTGMYDRALLALGTIKGDYGKILATYDESMRTRLLLEQEIISEMQEALQSGQFEAWYQPQYNHATGALIGAEELVRWRHPRKGLISPDIFISVFERNGFIYELDKYMWEQGCMLIRRWLDEGREIVPVSVNISRYDALRVDFLKTVTGIVDRYAVPHELFHMEITESAFSEDSEQLVSVIQSLVDDGFILEIDDFGSGYSSLNTLKDVPAQVLKLDMRFFSRTDNANRSGNIVESIVRMAKWLGMAVIAEGVEDKQHADYLKTIGCYYIQGYYYSKPVPVSEYEELIRGCLKEPDMTRLQTLETLDNNEFWNPKSMETLIFNSYVGGACIFEYHNGRTELLRVNDRYVLELGKLIPGDELVNTMIPLRYMGEDDRQKLLSNIENAISTNRESTCEVILSGTVDDKTCMEYIRTTMRVIARSGEHFLFYCVIVNTTKQHLAEQERLKAEQKQMESALRLEVIMKNINGGVSAIKIYPDGSSRLVFSNDKYYELYGYTREQAYKEKLDVMTTICPGDFPGVMEKVNKLEEDGKPVIIDFQITKRNGKKANLRANSSLMHMEDYGDVITSVITDVTEIISLQDQLRVIVANINGGVTATYVKDGSPHFIVVNDQFFRMLGYETREEYEAALPDKYTGVHPDDRERIIRQFETSDNGKDKYTMEYRVIRKDGEVRHIVNNISIVHLFGIDEPVQLSVANDVTDTYLIRRKEQLKTEQLLFLNTTAHDIMTQSDSDQAINKTLNSMLEYFRADRSYVVEIDYKNNVTNNTYEVHADNITPEMDNLQDVPFDDSDYWYDSLIKNRYLFIENVDKIDEVGTEMKAMLIRQGIRSIIIVSLYRNNELIGFMGVDNPVIAADQIVNMTALADYIAILLTRRDLENRINRSYKSMQLLIDDTPGGFLRMIVKQDTHPAIVSFNTGLCRMLGMTHDEIMEAYGDDVHKGLVPEDIKTLHEESSEASAAHGCFTSKCRLRCKDGKLLWVMVFGRFVEHDKGELFLNAYFSEIEEQKMSMQQMMPYIFPEIMKSSTDITFVKDRNLRYLCCSDACAKMIGLDGESDLVGKTDYELFDKDVADAMRMDDENLINTGVPVIDEHEVFISDEGMPAYSCMSKYLIKDEIGNPIAIYGVGRNTTKGQETNSQFNMLQNSIPGGLATLIYNDGNIRIDYYNERLCEWLGFPADKPDLTLQDMIKLILPEDVPIVNDFKEKLINDSVAKCVFRCRNKSGRFMWVNLKASVVYNEKNTSIINAVFLDVTELQAEKENLRKSEKIAKQNYEREIQLRGEVMKDSISYYQVNISRRTIEDYHTIYKNMQEPRDGSSINEELRDRILSGIVEEDRELVRNSLFSEALHSAYLKGITSLSIEFRSILPVGIRWTKGTATIMERYHSGDLIALINNQDIDARKKDEIVIANAVNEEIESVVVVNIGDEMAHFVQQSITNVNHKMEDYFRYGDVYGMMIRKVVIDEDRRECDEFYTMSHMIKALETEEVIKNEFRTRSGDGRIHHKKTQVSYVDDTRREIALIGRDITEQYEEEQQRNKKLKAAVEAAIKANNAKSEFLSQMSHDMRTPLNAILSFSNAEFMQDASKEQHERYLSKIHMSGEYLLGTLSDILDMSIIEKNKLVLHMAPYSSEEFYEMINDVISESCRKKNITFTMDIKDKVQNIITDKTRFNQVFINLLSNAVKFTNSGGHVEFISELMYVKDDDTHYRRFLIRDDGIGMSKEFMPHAFEIFEQENRVQQSEENHGTGLGLSIASKIVELMHGNIKLESEEGKGTTFTVELPLKVTDEQVIREEKYVNCLEGMRILLCEDNELNAEITSVLMERQGCMVDVAENGFIGLEMFRNSEKGSYQAILMDIRMPIMDGYTAAREIRRLDRPDAATIPIIAVSADVLSDDIMESDSVGMNAYLPKPIDDNMLFRTLLKYIND